MPACADADGGDAQRFRYFPAQLGGDLFEDEAEAAGFFEQFGVPLELFCLRFFLGPD